MEFHDSHCIRKGGFGKVYKGELVHSKGQHDNIVSLLGFCDDCGEKILRYALGQHEGLRNFIILVRPNKVLLDENWNARIADLSLSKFGPANQQYTFLVSNGVGTIGYCDPLYVETGLLTKKSDVYSFEVSIMPPPPSLSPAEPSASKKRPFSPSMSMQQSSPSENQHSAGSVLNHTPNVSDRPAPECLRGRRQRKVGL
ncbi:protein kinase, ATP binding site-containing protein [Tanacetum coccineum]